MLKNNRNGSLPFAAVAVIVLLLVSAWSATVFASRDVEEAADDIEESQDAVRKAEDSVAAWIERGLGEIICTVSADEHSSSRELKERFAELQDRWMESMFPAVESGVEVDVKEWSFDLGTELLTTDGSVPNGYSPAYLKATGSADLVLRSGSGLAARTVEISADGGSALPLTEERGSVFKCALEGGCSLLTQLMTYQLSALAQYRIMNGWGAFEYYGPSGTASIITAEDVVLSYRSCLAAVSSLKLNTGDGGWMSSKDAASYFFEGQELEIDLNAVYANALYGLVDNYAGKILELMGSQKVIQQLDRIADYLIGGFKQLSDFLTGGDSNTAEAYVRAVCGDIDYTVGGGSFVFVRDDGTEITFERPEFDVLDTPEIKSFYPMYRDEINGLRDWITGILNRAVASVADCKGLGAVRFTVSGNEDFAQVLREKAVEGVNGCQSALSSAMGEALRNGKYTDRASQAIWHYVDSAKGGRLLCDREGFRAMYVSALEKAAGCHIGDEGLEDQIEAAWREWHADVERLMDDLSPLLEVAADNQSVLEKALEAVFEMSFTVADLAVDVMPAIECMCNEFAAKISSLGASGVREYTDTVGFTLYGDGSEYLTVIDLEMTSDPVVTVSIDEDESVHSTSVSDFDVASYTTCWRITVDDRVQFTLTGHDNVFSRSGGTSTWSSVADVDADITVTAVSGWALYGVDYRCTDTIESILLTAALKGILSVLDPMMDMMKSLQDIMSVFSDISSMMCGPSSMMTEAVYKLQMGPSDGLSDFIEHAGGSAILGFIDWTEHMERTYNINLSSQSINMHYGGWSVKLTIYLGSLASSTKHIANIEIGGELGGTKFTASLDLKLRGSGDSQTPIITGKFSCKGNDWHIDGTIDPKMVYHDYIIEMKGQVKGVDVLIDIPFIEEYREVDLSLADIPVLGSVLTNIPFVIPGTLVSIDAGVDVKYGLPIETGVLINEAEANPAGEDKDREWAEVINLTGSDVDLNGWTLTNKKGKVCDIPGETLSPGERMVVELPGQFLNNTKETLTLKDAEGKTKDKMSLLNDESNDDRTCQRAVDGLDSLVLHSGTPGEKNKGGLFSKNGSVTKACLDILSESATEALGDMGGKVTTEEQLAQLIELIFKKALDKGIDRLSDFLVDAQAYIEVEFTDLTSSATLVGFRVYLSAGKDLASDLLKYLVGNLASLLFGVEDPYNINLGTAFLEDLYLGVTVYSGQGLPSFIDTSGDDDITIGVDVAANLSGIAGALGMDGGIAKVRAGIVVRNSPQSALPKQFDAQEGMDHDVWLFRMVLGFP